MAVLCRLLLLSISLYVTTRAQERCDNTGDVRLIGSVNMTEGRLEICVNDYWGTVCNDHRISDDRPFDRNAAIVVCRQLGFPESVVPELQSSVFFGGGGSFTPIHLDDLQCSGTEPNLLNCSHSGVGVNNCDHPEDIGIICQQSQDCTDGSVRLVDGDNYNATAGRVEYCVGGQWGTVCNYLWGEADVLVLCRQLGLNALDPKVLTDVPQVNDIRTPIVLDSLNCRHNEANLGQCRHAPVVEYCSHSDDAGANCTVIIECNDTDVRLFQLDGDTGNEGRVEYCSSGRWSLVCYDSWDTNDAKVICRQLGFNVEGGSVVAIDTRVGRDQPSTFITIVDCVGNEESISQCPQDNNGVCLNTGAGVICPVQINYECTDRDIRLRGGELSDRIGGVEVCMAGQWGLVCDDHWDDIDASVVCRQLGYTGGVAVNMSTFGTTLGQNFILDDVNCTGNESNIFDCLHPLSNDCNVLRKEEAGVICREGVDGRCTEDRLNETIAVNGSNFTNLTAGSIGICHSYLRLSNLCNSFYQSTDYIFTTMDQLLLSTVLDERILPFLSGDEGECGDLISRVLCYYFFASCGANGQLHLPLSVCQEECHYVQSICTNQWRTANNLLSSVGLNTITCSATGSLLQGLALCCVDAGIKIRPPSVHTVCSVVVWSNPQLPCDDIMGYEVRLYNPDSGHEVSRLVASYSTYYATTDEDKLQIELNKAYVQVRVVHNLLGAGKWSDGISLGCEAPNPKGSGSTEGLGDEGIIAVASSVTVLTIASVLLFIFGFLCGRFRHKMGMRAATENIQGDPNYDDMVLKRVIKI